MTNCEYYHVERPKLTKRERLYCELVEEGWLARDSDSCLWLYINKIPKKFSSSWDADTTNADVLELNVPNFSNAFSFIKWEDEQPWSIEDLLKLEVIE